MPLRHALLIAHLQGRIGHYCLEQVAFASPSNVNIGLDGMGMGMGTGMAESGYRKAFVIRRTCVRGFDDRAVDFWFLDGRAHVGKLCGGAGSYFKEGKVRYFR